MRDDTICALASGAGRAGVAVIRLSGHGCRGVLDRLAGLGGPEPRRLTRVTIRHPEDGSLLDRGLAVLFPGPASYTGEDVAELHVHGGPATVRSVLDALTESLGVRQAEPGEFTRRAFENGKMDLTAAEGIADLVAAETDAQRRQALRQLDGVLAGLYREWAGRLTHQLAYLEAHIDFPDEDLPPGMMDGVIGEVSALSTEISVHLADNRRGERLRGGIQIAIIGAPNVGKSSLLNSLARRDAAIVSATAGTTRDVIEVHLDLGGFPVTLADTAGIRAAIDDIELEGVRRSLKRAEDADLTIAMLDATDLSGNAVSRAGLVGGSSILVVNKIDLCLPDPLPVISGVEAVPVSVSTGEGLAALLTSIETWVASLIGSVSEPALTRVRHRTALEACLEALSRARDGGSTELVAEDLRLAVRALGRITGHVGVEDLLDVIFRDFCIGK